MKLEHHGGYGHPDLGAGIHFRGGGENLSIIRFSGGHNAINDRLAERYLKLAFSDMNKALQGTNPDWSQLIQIAKFSILDLTLETGVWIVNTDKGTFVEMLGISHDTKCLVKFRYITVKGSDLLNEITKRVSKYIDRMNGWRG